jgi:peptidoglycan DL-endopeptidase CwlO
MSAKNSRRAFIAATFIFCQVAQGATPALLETSDLKDFSKLSEPRQKLIESAIKAGKDVAGMPYKYGGNGPKYGGFDCSGAMHYILHQVDLNPPHTSSAQFLWIKENSKLHLISKTAKDTNDKSFAYLKPGDLVFWSGTYEPTDGRLTNITHFGMFLGFEKKDGHPVMINATNGRS